MVSEVEVMPTVNEVIVHCQKQIKKDPPEDKLLHYLGRLTRLRITTQDLVETGIGRTVNQLSRHDGEVGSAARKLVRSWKAVVAEESKVEASDSNSGSSSNDEEDEEEDNGDENDGSGQFVDKISGRHSDEDVSSHNDQLSVSEALDDDQDSDVSDRLCIDDDVPYIKQIAATAEAQKVLPSSTSDSSDSDSDGQDDGDENRKDSSSDSEHVDEPSECDSRHQTSSNGNYDGINHLDHSEKYEPKSSASSSHLSEDEYSDDSAPDTKKKTSTTNQKAKSDENFYQSVKPRANDQGNSKKSGKKYDSSEDEKVKNKMSVCKSNEKYSRDKGSGHWHSNSTKSSEKDVYNKVTIKKEQVDCDEEYEPDKPNYDYREKDSASNSSEKPRHRDKDRPKRQEPDNDKLKNNNKEVEKSKYTEKGRDKDSERSKRHGKSEKSRHNDRESDKSKYSNSHSDRSYKDIESKSSESKSLTPTVKVKTEPGYENTQIKEKDRSHKMETSKDTKSSASTKVKVDQGNSELHNNKERHRDRDNKNSDSKFSGAKIKTEIAGYDNLNNDRLSTQKNMESKTVLAYSASPKTESGYGSYANETDSSVKNKVKSEPKDERGSSSSSHRDRDEKHKSRKESKESHRDSKDKDRVKDSKEHRRDKEKDKDRENRKRKHNCEVSEKEEKSSSKHPKDSSESKKPKIETSETKSDKSKSKKPKLNIIREPIDSSSGLNFADVLGCLDAGSSKSSSKKKDKDSKDKSFKKSVIVPSSSRKDDVVSLVRKSDIDKLASEKNKNRGRNGVIESIIAPTVNISPNYKPATNVNIIPKLPKPSSIAPLSLGSLGLNDPNNWDDSRANFSVETDEGEALSTMITSRNQRTKVFSGNKTAIKGAVPKLFDLCMHVIQENIGDLGFTGGVPYDILKPALERATATQLYNIEDCNPYIIEDTDELWKFHSSRDFRGLHPQELESWRELYLRCMDERAARLQNLTNKMKRKVEVAEPVRKTKLAYLETHHGPRFSKSKAATIKNGMKSLKFREEKGVKREHGMSANSGGSSSGPSSGTVEEAAVIITPGHKASSAPAPSVSREREPSVAKMKPKKAPLMQKTMKLIKTIYRR